MKKKFIYTSLVFMFILSGCGNSKEDTVKDTLINEAGLSKSEADEFVSELDKDEINMIAEAISEENSEEAVSDEAPVQTDLQFEPCDEIKKANIKDAYVQIDDVLFKMDGSVTVGEVVDMLKKGSEGDLYTFNYKNDSEKEYSFDTAMINKRGFEQINLRKNGESYAMIQAYFDTGLSDDQTILIKDALVVSANPASSNEVAQKNIFLAKGVAFNGDGIEYESFVEQFCEGLTEGNNGDRDQYNFSQDHYNLDNITINQLPSGEYLFHKYTFTIDMNSQKGSQIGIAVMVSPR